MHDYIFFLFFLLYKIITTNDILYYLKEKEESLLDIYKYSLTENIINHIKLNDSSFLEDLTLSGKCKDVFRDTFFNEDNYIEFYQKLLFDSSFNKNDIHSYFKCDKSINIDNKVYKYKYLTLLINGDKSIYDELITNNNYSSGYLIGLCIIEGCQQDEYKVIIDKVLEYYDNITKNISNDDNNYISIEKDIISKIELFNLKNSNKSNGFIKFLEYLPFIIILIHLFFVIFNKLPLYIYNCSLYIFCCNNKKRILIRTTKTSNNSLRKKTKQSIAPVDSDRNPSINSFFSNADNFQKSVYLLFNIEKNFASLTEYKKQSEITNDSGLSYINGIKGISMIFLLFGSVYNALYNSFLVEKEQKEFFNHLKNFFFSLFYVGIKYAPKMLLCTSGFSLFFKFICFLDGKVENEEELIRKKEEKLFGGKEIQIINNENNNNPNNNSNTNSFYNTLLKSGSREIINKNVLISFKYVLYFYGMQFHKYLIYILFLSFIFFTLNRINLSIENPLPVWTFFNEKMINSVKEVKYLLPLLIGCKTHLIPGITNKKENILDYFYLVFQEIIYFLFTTLVIYIGYKRNIRIDRFFNILFLILFVFRIGYYNQKKLDDKNYFGYHDYGKFYTSILYDYTFYIVGIHYGMINYIIQKGYSFRDCSRQNKMYLLHSLRILKTTKRKSKKYLFIISLISGFILLVNLFIQQIIMLFYKIDKNKIINNYKKNIFTQIIMFIDTDIFAFFFNLAALFLYIKGDNKLNNILCHNFWSIFNRFYFSYILLINPIILYIIHYNESKIIFNLSTIFLYCFICGIIVFSISILVYIIFELPYKKIIHYWIKLKEKEDLKIRLSNLDSNYSYSQEKNLLDSATASITDFIDEEEEDEEEN